MVIRQPRILDWALCIFILVLQLLDVEGDPLRSRGVPIAPFQSVDGDCESSWFRTPSSFWVYGAEGAPGLPSDFVRASQRDGQLAVRGGPSCEKPNSLPRLDGLFFIPVSPRRVLKGSSHVLLHHSQGATLVTFQSSHILICSWSHAWDRTHHIQWRSRFLAIDAGERGNPGAIVYRASQGK